MHSTLPQPARRVPPTPAPRELLPSPTLPLIYVAGAHVALALACSVLALAPSLPGGYHYHPRLIALVHLVTLGWITGSILGALYIVVPLAFGAVLRAGRLDAAAAATFWLGAAGVTYGFWIGRYDVVAGSAPLVLVATAIVGGRVSLALRRSRTPLGVSLHVVLAFANLLVAGAAGAWIGLARISGSLSVSPLALAAAHAHFAVVGWAAMMIVGVSYRLVPMFLPAKMPTNPWIASSAVLLELGALALAGGLLAERSIVPGTLLVVAGFAAFFAQVRVVLRHRRPRPVELPRPDWSTWQTHLALLSLLVAVVVGIAIGRFGGSPARIWIYGTLGIVGFAAQMVVGIGGRLLPLHAWYRALQRRGAFPSRSVHRLADPRLTRGVLVLWLIGLPALTAGLAAGLPALVSVGALGLLAATGLNASLIARMNRATKAP